MFLINHKDGTYGLKNGFETQRQVEQHFASLDQDVYHEKIKKGLFSLISNIILFDADGTGSYFHFRYGIESTSSFKNLEFSTQQQLRSLYSHYFFKQQDDFWKKEAYNKLPALKRVTNMLVCGEDLGMVPGCVPEVMQQLGLLSLEIQRMPKNPATAFFHPNDAPYLSVVTPSTHDMSTIRGWWEEDKGKIQEFYNHELGQWGDAPYYCEAWINKAIVLQHLYSPAMWSVFQIQDLMGMNEKIRREDPLEEQINVPANPNHYWCYRMHTTIEELMSADDFNQELLTFIHKSGR
jgi:4-alpha-glucanotransferase